MIRCPMLITLATWAVAVPGALAQQPGQAPQYQPRPPGVLGGPSSPAAQRHNPSSASSYARTPYGPGLYDGDGSGRPAGESASGRGGTPGGADSAGTAAPSGSSSAHAVEVILMASGVPNRNGQVDWPLGLRLLRVDSQRLQLEAQLQLAAEQVVAGGANPQLLGEIRHNVEALSRFVRADREQRFSLPLAVYEDTEHFLQKLRRAPQVLAGSAPAGRSDEGSR